MMRSPIDSLSGQNVCNSRLQKKIPFTGALIVHTFHQLHIIKKRVNFMLFIIYVFFVITVNRRMKAEKIGDIMLICTLAYLQIGVNYVSLHATQGHDINCCTITYGG